MFVDLGCVGVALESGSAAVRVCAEAVFHTFLCDQIDNTIPFQLTSVADFGDVAAAEFLREFEEVLQKRPFFTHPLSQFAAYNAGPHAFLLMFANEAIVHVSVQGTGAVRGMIQERVLQNGRFEDIFYTSLAPILRRRGIYLVHAFSVMRNTACVLLVGPPHSGKTTAGLTLLQAGWQLLSNDVVLLTQAADHVVAWPTPGYVGIRPGTVQLLPDLPTASGILTTQQLLGEINGRFGTPTPISHLIFPQVAAGEPTSLTPLTAAEGWARLMGESMDFWDKETLAAHLAVLKGVCEKTAVFSLQSGYDIHQLEQLVF